MSLVARLVVAVVVAVVAYLLCILAGAVLALLGVPIAVLIGHFIEQWAVVISVLVFAWYFFVGYASHPFVRRRRISSRS